MRLALALLAALLFLPSRAEAGGRKCVEKSDVVGEHVCSTFGDDWSVERKLPVTFRFGLRYAEFSTDGRSFAEQLGKKRPKGYVGYAFPGRALGVSSLSGVGGDGGFTFFLVGQLYLGVEGGILFGSTRTASFTTRDGRHALSDSGGVDVTLAHAGIPIGYRIPLGRASIRGEVLTGGVIATVSQDVKAVGRGPDATAAATRGMIEPRIAADIWFTQHMSFGAYAGVNMLDTQSRAFGLSLTFHHRAFDGDMSLW
jgi:hypothetical protein